MRAIALTPALSQREWVPSQDAFWLPLPLGEGWGEGLRASHVFITPTLEL